MSATPGKRSALKLPKLRIKEELIRTAPELARVLVDADPRSGNFSGTKTSASASPPPKGGAPPPRRPGATTREFDVPEEVKLDMDLRQAKAERADLLSSLTALRQDSLRSGGQLQREDVSALRAEIRLKQARLNDLLHAHGAGQRRLETLRAESWTAARAGLQLAGPLEARAAELAAALAAAEREGALLEEARTQASQAGDLARAMCARALEGHDRAANLAAAARRDQEDLFAAAASTATEQEAAEKALRRERASAAALAGDWRRKLRDRRREVRDLERRNAEHERQMEAARRAQEARDRRLWESIAASADGEAVEPAGGAAAGPRRAAGGAPMELAERQWMRLLAAAGVAAPEDVLGSWNALKAREAGMATLLDLARGRETDALAQLQSAQERYAAAAGGAAPPAGDVGGEAEALPPRGTGEGREESGGEAEGVEREDGMHLDGILGEETSPRASLDGGNGPTDGVEDASQSPTAEPAGQSPAAEPAGQPIAAEPAGQPIAAEPAGQSIAADPAGQSIAADPAAQSPLGAGGLQLASTPLAKRPTVTPTAPPSLSSASTPHVPRQQTPAALGLFAATPKAASSRLSALEDAQQKLRLARAACSQAKRDVARLHRICVLAQQSLSVMEHLMRGIVGSEEAAEKPAFSKEAPALPAAIAEENGQEVEASQARPRIRHALSSDTPPSAPLQAGMFSHRRAVEASHFTLPLYSGRPQPKASVSFKLGGEHASPFPEILPLLHSIEEKTLAVVEARWNPPRVEVEHRVFATPRAGRGDEKSVASGGARPPSPRASSAQEPGSDPEERTANALVEADDAAAVSEADSSRSRQALEDTSAIKEALEALSARDDDVDLETAPFSILAETQALVPASSGRRALRSLSGSKKLETSAPSGGPLIKAKRAADRAGFKRGTFVGPAWDTDFAAGAPLPSSLGTQPRRKPKPGRLVGLVAEPFKTRSEEFELDASSSDGEWIVDRDYLKLRANRLMKGRGAKGGAASKSPGSNSGQGPVGRGPVAIL